MSFAVFQRLTQSTVIEGCLVCSLTSATNLVLNKGDHLEVYEVDRKENHLVFSFDLRLFGRPEAMVSFRPETSETDHLALVFQNARFLSVLKYSPEFGSARTCGQHMLMTGDDPGAGNGGFEPQAVVDPDHRCLAVRARTDRVVVFPISGTSCWRFGGHQAGLSFHEDPEQLPGLCTPFTFSAWASLRLHHIEDMAFLHGYYQPTAACLGQVKVGWGGCLNDSNGNSSIIIVALDLVKKEPHLVWSTHNLPHSIFRIIPLRYPVSGMLVLSNNAVLYMKEHGTSLCQKLNAFTSVGKEFANLEMPIKDDTALNVCLTGCSAVVMSPTVLLVSIQPTGRLYLVHLVLGSKDIVTDMIWTSPGTAAPATGLCALAGEFVFLASRATSSLLKLTPDHKKLPQPMPRKRLRSLSSSEAPAENTEAPAEKAEKAPPSDTMLELMAIHESLRESERLLTSFTLKVVDDVQSFGAIESLAPWSSEEGCGNGRFICCSGCCSGSRGSMFVLQRAVPLETLVEFDIGPRYSAVWTCGETLEVEEVSSKRARIDPGDGEEERRGLGCGIGFVRAESAEDEVEHRYVIMSGTSTKVLEATKEIEEITKSTPLDGQTSTVAAGCVLQQRLVVQVTPHRMCFMRTCNPKAENVPRPIVFHQGTLDRNAPAKEPVLARSGSISEPYVAVTFSDLTIRLFAVRSESNIAELTHLLPKSSAEAGGSASDDMVVCSSLFKCAKMGTTFLTVVAPSSHGTLRIVDVEKMCVVFTVKHVAEVPPVLRPCSSTDDSKLDHFRSLTDSCAVLPKGSMDPKVMKPKAEDSARAGRSAGHDVASVLAESAASAVVCADLVLVDPADSGPTLILLMVGRPVLIFRAFVAPTTQEFPFHFSLWEHDFLGLLEARPQGPCRAVVAVDHLPHGGVIVAPPETGIPALWLVASRNRLFVHPLPGVKTCAVAPLQAPCCERGLFALSKVEDAVTASVLSLSLLEGVPENSASFELRAPLPHVQIPLQRTPHILATQPAHEVIALSVSDVVEDTAEPHVNIDDDPLGDDWSIVRAPPVDHTPSPVPRLQPRHELWIDKAKDLSKLGQYRFSFDVEEHVLCLEWVTLPGFPSPSLAVGTGVNCNEDLTCRGRVLIFSTKDREPGVVPAIYQKSLKWPVTVVGQWGSYFVHSEGYKLYFERWEGGNFNKLAFFDGSMCITSMSSIKNFIVLGDLRKGIDFVQWKEEAHTQTRSLRRLSRSPPSTSMTVLACDFVVCQKSLGLVVLDHSGSVHLLQYSAHSDGREGDQLLRSCASFAMGFPCRTVLRMQTEAAMQCLFMASAGGEFLCIKPIDDHVYRTTTTLLGILAQRLPFRAGLNPRTFRHHRGPPALVAPRKNIEDAVLLQVFVFLSGPLQTSVADKMRLPVSALLRAAVPCASCQLFALKPTGSAGESRN